MSVKKSWYAVAGLAVLLALSAQAAAAAGKTASWTVMVYLNADNNLDAYGYADIAEMAAVGSTSSVNVVVLWDTFDGPAYLYRVVQGGVEVVKGFALNGKEANMGSGDTLGAFVDFAVAKFPAAKYNLVLWDHGDDFRGFSWDDHPGEGTGDDFMTHDEIIAALTGHPLDILAYDGCVMGNLEVSYEYVARGLDIELLVASEIYIPLEGFAYDGLLAAVAADPGMAPVDFAKAMVDSYWDFYDNPGWQVGLSVIRMSEVAELVAATGEVSRMLAADMPAYRSAVASARGTAMLSWSMYGWEAFIDFGTWAHTLEVQVGTDPALGAVLDRVLVALEDTVPYVRNTHTLDVKGASGIGVFFPGSEGSFEHNIYWHGDYYLRTRFPYEGWLGMLEEYWGGK